jgi:toxin ParE1/3/4
VVKARLSEAAEADLAAIDAFGAECFGDLAADTYQQGLARVFARLQDFPLSGEERPDYGSGIRCAIYRKHRILYFVESDTVWIVRILHHSRHVPRHISQ